MIPNNFQIYVVISLLLFFVCLCGESVRFICFEKKNKGNFHNFIEFLFLGFLVVCVYFIAFRIVYICQGIGTAGVIIIIIIVYIRARDREYGIRDNFWPFMCINTMESPWLVEFHWNRNRNRNKHNVDLFLSPLHIVFIFSQQKKLGKEITKIYSIVSSVCTYVRPQTHTQ